MKAEDIHDEIRRTRDALMEECGGDLQRFGDLRRAGEARWAAAGHPVASFVGEPLRELPPGVPPYRGEGEDNEILREIRATRRQMMEECGGDPGKLLDHVAEGGSCVVREEPPKP